MHRSLSSLTQRIERVLDERLIPAIYRDAEPVHVEAAHLPGEPIPAGGALFVLRDAEALGKDFGDQGLGRGIALFGAGQGALQGGEEIAALKGTKSFVHRQAGAGSFSRRGGGFKRRSRCFG